MLPLAEGAFLNLPGPADLLYGLGYLACITLASVLGVTGLVFLINYFVKRRQKQRDETRRRRGLNP